MKNPSRRRFPRFPAALLLTALALLAAALVQAAPGVAVAPKSRLVYPVGADLWVDADGTPAAPTPGVALGALRRVSVLVFRPVGDTISWEALVSLYVKQGLLPESPRAEFSATQVPTTEAAAADPNANAEETNVYKPVSGGDFLALGVIRNLRTQHMLAYGAMIEGKLTAVQALAQAKSVVGDLAGRAKLLRTTPPVPPGAVAAGRTLRLQGPLIAQLMQSIEQSQVATPRVKAMARVVVPQATAVTLSTWRTQAPMSDVAFFAFYTEAAARMGWGPPISRDETQPGRPTLLFQRAGNDGVVMIRAQASPLVAGTPPSTTIFILAMEGRINASALVTK